MPAPFLTANDVIAMVSDRGGIASVNGYDPIEIAVEVSAVMSDSLTLRAGSLSELKKLIAAELNRQFEAPITYAAKDDCAGWSNRATWKLALAFSHNLALYQAKNVYLNTLEGLCVTPSTEMISRFAKAAANEFSSFGPNSESAFDIIWDDVNWEELTQSWRTEYEQLANPVAI